MSIADQIIRAKNDYDEVYAAGKKAEYDAFWDAYQQNGNRKDYSNAFSGTGWTPETLKPKYKVVPGERETDAEGMFYRFNWIREGITNDLLDFSKIAHLFDFSNVTKAASLFHSAAIDNIIVDISNATNCSYAFYTSWGTNGLTNITLKVSENTPLHDAFGGTHRNLSFIDGSIIGQNISLSGASDLTKQSFINVVNALSSSASGKTATFKKSAKEVAFTADEWATLIGTKPNWTISLV
mgnify:CR=1 FL=1